MATANGRADQIVAGRPSRLYSWVVVTAGWLVVPAVVAGAIVAAVSLPGISALPAAGVGALLPKRTAATDAEIQAGRLFGSALLPRIAIVQRDPEGLSLGAQRKIVASAVMLDRDRLPGFPRGSRALPYVNTLGLVPAAKERGTTAITYLGLPTSLSPDEQTDLAQRYAQRVSVPGAPAAATGFIPGSVAQSNAIDRGLIRVEVAAILLVALILGVYFRSLFAPLITLSAAGIAYLVAIHVMSYLASEFGLSIEAEVEPIIVVLLLAVVTDYSVFLLSGMRARLRDGESARPAARRATAEVLPIIVTAGLLVAAGLATLRLASIGFVRALGPAMAIVILISLAVSLLFVPAAMGILGRMTFWPGLGSREKVEPFPARFAGSLRTAVASMTSKRLGAVPTVVVAIVLLALAATGLSRARLALTPVRGLEPTTPAARAEREAERGFAAGIVAPTELVLRGRGIGSESMRLKEFGRSLGSESAVAGAVGAALPVLPRSVQAVFTAPGGDAVRYFVILRHHPYSSAGIDDFRRLQGDMPHLLSSAGLDQATVSYAGDTAIASETTHLTVRDLLLVGAAATIVSLLLLGVFLRSVIAPVLMIATSLLGIAATLGVTASVNQLVSGTSDLTYYVPLAVGVFLLALGTDYNLFVVGRIWQEAGHREMGPAIRVAVPRAGRAISIAALALAVSFATLALIPVAPFRQFAFAVTVGVLIDAFLVRTLLIPALLSTFGETSRWPGRRRTETTFAGEKMTSGG